MLNDQTTPTAPDIDELDELDGLQTATPTQDGSSAEQLEQLLVLSQAPLSLEDALQQEAKRGEDPAPLTAGRLVKQFASLVALFLGVGLVTAAVRHYGDDTKLYLGISIAGAALFAAGSVMLDPRSRRDGAKGLVRFAALSLLFGLGLGLLVGGILHFTAFPKTGAVLVPLGLALSIAAFVARDGRALIGKDLISAGVTFAGVLVWLGVGLGMAAKKMEPTPPTPAAAHGAAAGDHGAAAPAGSHGAAAGAGEHGAAEGNAHGAAAAEGHGDAAKADAHGDAAKTDAHGAAASAGHGETAAAAGHGAEAKAPAAAHGDRAAVPAKAEGHATEAKADAHATDAKADHGTAAAETDSHAAADSHGAASSKSSAAKEEDEVTAADVLVPRNKH